MMFAFSFCSIRKKKKSKIMYLNLYLYLYFLLLLLRLVLLITFDSTVLHVSLVSIVEKHGNWETSTILTENDRWDII